MAAPTPDRDLDIALFGATGFVGRLVAGYLAVHTPAGVRVGLAGRSAERLAALRAGLPAAAHGWPLSVVDAADPASVASLAARSRVVATTVGPYLHHGFPLAEACARAGTDYVDLAGEVLFVRRSADRLHDLAAQSGARLVHSCGFDSIPSDLGVLLLATRAAADEAGPLEDTTLLVRSIRGGVSGGTIASLRGQVDEARSDPRLAAVLRDPYALSPDRTAEPDLGDERDRSRPGRDPQLGVWTAPFVMARHNTRIVRRSNALRGWAYGRGFRYREVQGTGTGITAPLRAGAITAGLGAVGAAMAFAPARAVLDRVLPDPGTGPSEDTRAKGGFRLDCHTRTSSGARYRAVVAAAGDPGYAATSVMLAESALALLLDRDGLPEAAGVLTPATGIGLPLVDRLRLAGFRCSVEPR